MITVCIGKVKVHGAFVIFNNSADIYQLSYDSLDFYLTSYLDLIPALV
jgi:hypothetical protein